MKSEAEKPRAAEDHATPVAAMDALRRENEVLKTLLNHLPVMVGFYSATGDILLVNRELERVMGWSKEEYATVDVLGACYPDPDLLAEVREHIIASNATWKDFKTRVRDGRVLDTAWAQIRLPDGRSIGIGQDITERKRLEEQLAQARRMEAIGRLAGGVAHDFNNLLTVILGRAEVALRRSQPGGAPYESLQEIARAAESAAALTRQLLAFARRQMIAPERVDLNNLVGDVAQILRRVLGEHVEFVFSPAADLAPVRIDPGQFEQVLINLAANARDAMPSGGRLVIETRNVALDETFAAQHAGVTPGPYVMLAISDQGVGMSAETLAHAFEPFVTTKEAGQGTGLGLATCYGIVRQNGGTIWVYSEPDRGTTFKIYLPREGGDAARATPRAAISAEATGGSEAVLVVEDDARVRQLTVDALAERGYKVLPADGPEQALRIAAERGGRIDLLLTDVVMPGLSGRELAARLVETNPGLRVLFMSGYAESAIVHHGVLDRGLSFLAKPFTLAALTVRVRQLLDAAPSRASR